MIDAVIDYVAGDAEYLIGIDLFSLKVLEGLEFILLDPIGYNRYNWSS